MSDHMEAARRLTEAGTFALYRYVDPIVEELGVGVRSEYTEVYWLPVLGPSSLFMLRHLDRESWFGNESVVFADMARSLGLGVGGQKPNGPAVRTLARLMDFDMAATDRDGLAVRKALPPLPARYHRQVPERWRRRAMHDAVLGIANKELVGGRA